MVDKHLKKEGVTEKLTPQSESLRNMETKLPEYEFVKRAIKRLRQSPDKGIHSDCSGFNDAFREYFNKDPVKFTKELAQEGKIVIIPVKDGIKLYLPEDAPTESRGNDNKGTGSDKTRKGRADRKSEARQDLRNRVSEINEFVKKAMGVPPAGQLDWWQESSYAALFSSSWEPFLIFVHSESRSLHEFNEFLDIFIKELTEKASAWVETGFLESVPSEYRGKIKIKGGSTAHEIQHRLHSYFSIALAAMADRNYDIETARSHSCFVILSKVFESLSIADNSRSPKEVMKFFENLMSMCKGLACDIHDNFQTKIKNDNI